MHKYLPQTNKDIEEMLNRIGVKNVQQLFLDVPKEIIDKDKIDIPSHKSEQEIYSYFKDIASKNIPLKIFAGGGAYDHYTPSAIYAITSRQEFLTSYTPYQAEISQGTLQYIFEYQSMICELTGLDVANASLYDGATSASEAMFIATSQAKKNVFAVSMGVNPRITQVIKTYAKFRNIEIVMIPLKNGRTSLEEFSKINDGRLAGVLTQTPNYYGLIEDSSEINRLIHEKNGYAISYVNPLTLGLLKTPSEMAADIAVGDGQPLGIPLNFGGPYIGFMAAKTSLLRKIPGRIVGMSKDSEGKNCYVLTLQAREQHIRREKAVSNICSNQSLMALWVTIYLSLLGKNGLEEVGKLNIANSHYLYELLLKTKKFVKVYDDNFFNEFVVRPLVKISSVEKILAKNGMSSGIVVDGKNLMFAVTEKRTKEEIEKFANLLGGLDYE